MTEDNSTIAGNPKRRRPVRPTVYPSGVDTWIAVMLGFTPILAAALGVALLLLGRHNDAMILFLTAFATLVVTAVFTVPCQYTMLDDALAVRCGIIGYRIPYDQIESVEPSRTIVSGPALSMNRVLVITDKKRKHILSPRQRDEFIEDIQAVISEHKQMS